MVYRHLVVADNFRRKPPDPITRDKALEILARFLVKTGTPNEMLTTAEATANRDGFARIDDPGWGRGTITVAARSRS